MENSWYLPVKVKERILVGEWSTLDPFKAHPTGNRSSDALVRADAL